jgi:hypothetical protein
MQAHLLRIKSGGRLKQEILHRLLNDHHLKGGGLTLRLKVACLRLKPLEIFPAESRLKARSAL